MTAPASRMKFGMFMAPFHRAGENPTLALQRDIELIQHMERLGYVWIGEHHSGSRELIADPALFIAAAAERTSTIKLGTGVTSLPYHHPFIVADQMNLLDHLTKGRAMLGIGPGVLASDAYMLGIEPTEQRRMMNESIDVIMRLLRGEVVTHHSDWFELNEAQLQLQPYSDPHLPVAVATSFTPSNVSMLRQQIRPSARIHGIITEGGEATNVIPRRAAARFGVREATIADLERLLPRVRACFEAAAASTGCELELTQGARGYSELRTNQAMAARYAAHAEDCGLRAVTAVTDSGGSTDMGNVSLVVPLIHPMFGIASEAGNHNEGFTDAAGTPAAHGQMLSAAKALAHTAYELFTDGELLDTTRREFEDAAS